MRPLLLLIVTTQLLACGAARLPAEPATATATRVRVARCDRIAFDRQDLRFRCGGVTYDLLRKPVRSRRVFDIVSRQTFTRRHYVKDGYAYKTVQLGSERYPRMVMLETQAGFRHLVLDRQGNVIQSVRAPDLSN
jgi:hypothetical protein